MAGFLAQAAVRRTPVLLDGMVVTAAALVAERLAPGARAWWQAGRSRPNRHSLALAQLELRPIVDLGMRLGEGSGAAVALPVLRAAIATPDRDGHLRHPPASRAAATHDPRHIGFPGSPPCLSAHRAAAGPGR